MSKQPILFVINPNAGTQRQKGGFKELIKKHLNLGCFDPIIEFTQYARHATELTDEYMAKGITEFVAVGGDGTINEIAKHLIHKKANLSIISKGSGNGLARHLKLHESDIAALQKLHLRKPTKIDVGYLNGLPFLCTAGVGFDAYCAHRFHQEPGNRGIQNYIKTGFKSYFDYDGIWVKKGSEYEHLFSLSFGNAAQFGNNAFIAPLAVINDGLIDCAKIKTHPMLYTVDLGQRLFTKTLHKSSYVSYEQKSCFEFDLKNKEFVHIDGEALPMKYDNIKVEIAEKALSIRI
ncbi:diacylglycerol/lipid kinase family protein [Jiulongibacter sp. NS-SX5]|uniref:diacylglycerol/lipid kinase family protein n=1 Tax=Jiulongibacter sp. NS-SX5 TaxID=3463854 RepID=UPI00405A2DED